MGKALGFKDKGDKVNTQKTDINFIYINSQVGNIFRLNTIDYTVKE